MRYITENEALAMNLLNLLKHHKLTCNSPTCGVSLSVFQKLYETLVKRNINTEEEQYFM